MKIGLFIDTYYPMVDGVIKVVDNYARRLAQKGDVTVFCPGSRDSSYEEDAVKFPYRIQRCLSLPLPHLDYTFPTPLLDARFIASLAHSRLDIVHIHSPFTVGTAGMNYAKLHKTPLVATLHSQYKQDIEKNLHLKPGIDLAMFGLMNVFNACDECWAVNEAIKQLYIEEYGLTAPCRVKLNATDHTPVADKEVAARKVNETYGLDPDDRILLFIGRINFIKNLDFLTRALKSVKDKGQKFKMLFVGKGQDEGALKSLVSELGLGNDVVMCGQVTDIHELENIYSRAAIFLFPSLYDANSLVQIEAACQGTPTLFLRGAKTAGTVTEDVNGFISERSEEAFAGKIVEILSNDEYRKTVAEGAKRDLYHSWDDIVESVFADYQRLIG